MKWMDTLMKAVHFMENNLTSDISLEDVSNHVYTSNSNLQRIFKSVTGVTIGDYIRNRRLSLSGQDLLLTSSKIIDIALRYQYCTSESFSKAFARFHGVPPSAVQNQNKTPKFFHPFTINVSIQGGFSMSKQIVMPTFRGQVGKYELTENGFTANSLNGEVLFPFEKLDSTPSAVKFESTSDNGDMHVSVQYLKNGKKDNSPENMETRKDSTIGKGVFDLKNLVNGYYVLRGETKNAENVSFRYEFIN